jgi:hypothetical protein
MPDMPDLFSPLEREQRLSEWVAEKILDLISTRAWKPGYHLPIPVAESLENAVLPQVADIVAAVEEMI